MFIVHLYREDEENEGEQIPLILAFPEKAEEISLRQYAEYREIWENLPSFVTEKPLEEWDEEQTIEYMEIQTRALLILTKVQMPDGSYERCTEDDILAIPADEDSDIARSALFTKVVRVIDRYKPKELSRFTYKGCNFVVPEHMKLGNRIVRHGVNISTIEAIEALQLEHIYNKKKGAERLYHSDLGVMAAVCRKIVDGKKEKLPINTKKRRELITERIAFFSDIPMTVALDVAFFLTDSNTILNILQALDSYINLVQQLPSKQNNWQKPVRNGKLTDGITRL